CSDEIPKQRHNSGVETSVPATGEGDCSGFQDSSLIFLKVSAGATPIKNSRSAMCRKILNILRDLEAPMEELQRSCHCWKSQA
ncbi:hypothetical protein U1Q18_035935, partial [Sarracenia purpurea var. burkii]